MFQVFLIIIQLLKTKNLRQELFVFPPCDKDINKDIFKFEKLIIIINVSNYSPN